MAADSGAQKGLDMAARIVRTCMAGRVRQISRAVTARYDDELRPLGITTNQLTILATVAVLEKATQSDLQPYLLMEASTLSRNVARMLDRHWLATLPGEDRRSHYLVVAPDGFRILEAVRPRWESAHEWAREALGDPDAVMELAHRVNPRLPR